jgi:hypothetical protein
MQRPSPYRRLIDPAYTHVVTADLLDGAAITRLLHQWQDGSRDAFEQLVPLVYQELHVLASKTLEALDPDQAANR